MIPAERRTPVESALVDALADVRHVGDYGTLWVANRGLRVHLTLGDSDGDPERGCTPFPEIVARIIEAVQPFWPDWPLGHYEVCAEAADAQSVGEPCALPLGHTGPHCGPSLRESLFRRLPHALPTNDHDSPLRLADEWHPDGDPEHGWVEVGPIGREITLTDELRAHTWAELIRAHSIVAVCGLWRYHDDPDHLRAFDEPPPPEFLAAWRELEKAEPHLKAAVEILRPLARPEQAPRSPTPGGTIE